MSTLQKLMDDCDPSTEENKRLREELRLLMSCAVANAKLGERAITDSLTAQPSKENLFLPVTNIIESMSETHAITTEDTAAITHRVKQSLKRFYDPNDEAILNGFASLLTDALTGLMGEGRGIEAQQEVHLVGIEGLGFIRLDFAIWMQNLDTIGIRAKCQHAVSVVAVKSAIDVSKIQLSTFLVLYGRVLDQSYDHDEKKAIEKIAQAKQVFIELGGILPQAPTQTQTASLPGSDSGIGLTLYKALPSANNMRVRRKAPIKRAKFRGGKIRSSVQEGHGVPHSADIMAKYITLEKDNSMINSAEGKQLVEITVGSGIPTKHKPAQITLVEKMPSILYDLGIISPPPESSIKHVQIKGVGRTQSERFKGASVKVGTTGYPFLIKESDMFGKITVKGF